MVIFSFFEGPPYCFPLWLPVDHLTSSVQAFLFLHILVNICYVWSSGQMRPLLRRQRAYSPPTIDLHSSWKNKTNYSFKLVWLQQCLLPQQTLAHPDYISTQKKSNFRLISNLWHVWFSRHHMYQIFLVSKCSKPIQFVSYKRQGLIGKDPDAGKDWKQEEKGTTEDEMVGWHHQLNRHEFE